jgi:hypothetical protein
MHYKIAHISEITDPIDIEIKKLGVLTVTNILRKMQISAKLVMIETQLRTENSILLQWNQNQSPWKIKYNVIVLYLHIINKYIFFSKDIKAFQCQYTK